MTQLQQTPASLTLVDSRLHIRGAAWVDGVALSATTRCARQLVFVSDSGEHAFTLARDTPRMPAGVALGVLPATKNKKALSQQKRAHTLDYSASSFVVADAAGIDLNALTDGVYECFVELTIAGEVVRAPLHGDMLEPIYHIACGSIFAVHNAPTGVKISRTSVTDALADGTFAASGSTTHVAVENDRLFVSGEFVVSPEALHLANTTGNIGSCYVVLLSAWHCHGVELVVTPPSDSSPGRIHYSARSPLGLPLAQVPAGHYHVVTMWLQGGNVAAYHVASVRVSVQPGFTKVPESTNPLEPRPLVAMVGSGFAADALAHPDESLQAQVENHFRIEVWGADIVSVGHSDVSPRFAGGLTTDLVSLSPDVVVWDLFSVAALGAARGGSLDELLQVLGDLIAAITAATGPVTRMRHVVQAVRFAPQVNAHGERVLGQFGLVNDWNESIEQLWVERLGAEVLSPAEVPLPPSTTWPPASEDIYVLPSLGSAVDLITELRRALGYRGDVLAVEPLGELHAD